MINGKADKITKEFSDSLKNRYQNNLESIKGNEFVFDYIHLLYCIKINLNHGGSYIDYLDRLKNKKSTINPINTKGNMFSIRSNSCIKS